MLIELFSSQKQLDFMLRACTQGAIYFNKMLRFEMKVAIDKLRFDFWCENRNFPGALVLLELGTLGPRLVRCETATASYESNGFPSYEEGYELHDEAPLSLPDTAEFQLRLRHQGAIIPKGQLSTYLNVEHRTRADRVLLR
eukprot:IDg8293t1